MAPVVGVPAVLLLASVFAASPAAGPDLERPERQYRRTDYASVLETLLPLHAKNAAVYALIGKAYYMDGRYRESASYLEQAVGEEPCNSSFYDWLGRAYGRRAEQAGFVTALSYAGKTHAAFEKAVTCGPSNLEALSDLFEFYLEAPRIAGGGVDKAEGIAGRIALLNQAEYHYARARLAGKGRDFSEAERELRAAMEAAPGEAGRVIDLAAFLARQGRYLESERIFAQAQQIDQDAPRLLFAHAEAYIQSRRNLEQAKALLQQYEQSRITPDDPPRSEVVRLRKAMH